MKDFIIKHRIIILIGVFFLVIAPAFVYGARIMVNSIEGTATEIKAARIEGIVDQKFLSSVQELRTEANLIRENIAQTPILVEDNDKSKVNLFAFVKQMALDTGSLNPNVLIVDEEARARAQKLEGKLQIVPVHEDYVQAEIAMSGTYQNFIDFTHRIESMRYGADILGFTLKKKDQNARARRGSKDTTDVEDVRTDALLITVSFVVYTEVAEDISNDELNVDLEDEAGSGPS